MIRVVLDVRVYAGNHRNVCMTGEMTDRDGIDSGFQQSSHKRMPEVVQAKLHPDLRFHPSETASGVVPAPTAPASVAEEFARWIRLQEPSDDLFGDWR